jgi:ethanolamine utilization protein EutP
MVNREVIGIVTKINDPKANRSLAELWLRNAGCRDIFFVDSVTGEGVDAILEYLNRPKEKRRLGHRELSGSRTETTEIKQKRQDST